MTVKGDKVDNRQYYYDSIIESLTIQAFWDTMQKTKPKQYFLIKYMEKPPHSALL